MVERHGSGDRLSAFLDDELDDDEALRVTRHLADCERCLGELTALRATRDALRRLPSLQAPVLSGGIQAGSKRLARMGRRLRVGAVVCALSVLLGGAFYALGAEPGDLELDTELLLVEHLSRTAGGPGPSASWVDQR